MSAIECPHCVRTVDSILSKQGVAGVDISDWYYRHNLYAVDTTTKLECPGCAQTFFVRAHESIEYESATTEDEL